MSRVAGIPREARGRDRRKPPDADGMTGRFYHGLSEAAP